jgi:hypothetical protein
MTAISTSQENSADHKALPAEPRVFAITGKQRLGKGDRNTDAPHRVQGEHEEPPRPADAEDVA